MFRRELQPKWPRNMPGPEHNDFRTVSIDVIPPMGFPFLSMKEPYSTVQFAREMTLASGQTLYEVWDPRKRKIVGFNIPTEILLAARIHCAGHMDPADWKSLPRETRQEFYRTQQLIMDIFPGIPECSSKVITENLIEKSFWGRVSNLDIEQEVVHHAKHCWTGLASRVEQKKREGKTGAWEADKEETNVRRRLRTVLGRWMGDVANVEKERFFDRHHLGDVAAIIENGKQVEAGRVAGYGGAMVWNEGTLTIIGVTTDPGEKQFKRFL